MTAVKDEMSVKLTFDNKQFEQGVRQSSESITRLKSALELKQQIGSFKEFKKVASSLGMPFSTLKKDMGTISAFGKEIDKLTNKTTLLGKAFKDVGFFIKKNIVDDVYKKAKGILTGIPNQIISGGQRRAQNIEQAQFQLKGLLKDEYNWKQISEDLDFAVSGTRYGLDAAAKAAAQLKASNIGFGDEMKTALRGISGVAAMTNSEYEDIAHIFTTIAGQGRMMTEQLNQFAGRGLNVAATLAEHYKVSEAQLREMVTKGKVDFKTFAKAMNDAFGEQATKANDTFSGALSNVKASLSRMGAQFMTPGFEELRKVLVMLIPVFKDIEKFIKPVSARFEELAKVVSGFAVDTLRGIHFDFLDMLGIKGTSYASQVGELTGIFDEITGKVDKALDSGTTKTSEGAEETVKQLKTANDLYKTAIELHATLEESAKNRIKSGDDEATVQKELDMAYQAIGSTLADYEKLIDGTADAEKELTEEQKKAIDAASKKGAIDNTTRNKALGLYAAEIQETNAVKDNTAARNDATDAAVKSTKAMAEAGKVAASNLFGLESGAFDTSVKRVTDYLDSVQKQSESTFKYGGLGDLIDPAKQLANETAIQQGLYTELEKAVEEINKTAEKQIKLGKDETVVNKEKEAALQRLKEAAEAYDKQSVFSLDLLNKDSKGRKATTKLYEDAKKTVDGLKSNFLKLLGIEQEEGEQVAQNGTEYQNLEELAKDVIAGKYDNGEERKKKLGELGLSYAIIQNKVNELLGVEKRHEVTAEDEAKMMKKFGGEAAEAGEKVEEQKTTFEKLLDVLAGFGAVLSIVRSAGGAIMENIVKPFIGYALPKIFDAILGFLSPIGEKLVQLNQWLTDTNFFEVKTKEVAEWFKNAKDSVVEFWGKAKELEGVKKLSEAFEKLKTVVGDIGGKIFGKLKEGFDSVGDGASSIFTMENLLNLLNTIAEKIAAIFNFVAEHEDDIVNALKTVYDFLVAVKNGVIEFFKDPIGSIKKFGTFIQNSLSDIRSKITTFAGKLAADPKATLTDFFGKLFTTIGVVKGKIQAFFSSFAGSAKDGASDAVAKAFDIKDAAASLFDKGKSLFVSFINGIKAFFGDSGLGGSVIKTVKIFIGKVIENFDPKKAGLIAGAGGIGLVAAKIAKFILSLRNTFSLAKELPKKATELLSGLKGVLDGYAMNLKIDALLKVAGAIGIFALAITALSFIDQSKLLAVGGSLGAILVGMAALIAAIGMYNKARAMAKAAGVAESIKGVATAASGAANSAGEAAKTAMTNPFAPIYQSVGDFLTGMKDALAKAAKTASMGVFLVMLAASIGILVLCVKSLLKVDWQKEGIPAAIAVGVMLAALVASVAILNKVGGNGLKAGTGLGLIGIVTSLYMLIGVVKMFATWATKDSDSLITGLTYVALMLAGIAAFSRLLKPDGLLKAAASFILLSVALTLMLVPLIAFSLIPTDMMAAGILRVIELLGVLVVASMAASKAGQGGGIKTLLALAGVILLLAPAMLLLGVAGMVAWKGIGALAAAIGLLVVAAIVLDKWGGDGLEKLTNGFYKLSMATLLLGPAIVILGLCLTAFGALFQKFWPQMLIGFAAFAVGLTVIGAIASKFAVGFAAISLPLVALVGVILAFVLAIALLPNAAENLKNFVDTMAKGIGGVAKGIGEFFGFMKEESSGFVSALDNYKISLEGMKFLSDDVKKELEGRFEEMKHLDGSAYTIGLQNVIGYIESLDLTQEQIQTLLNTTMTNLQNQAKEDFVISFQKVRADIKKLDLPPDEEAELMEHVKALASLTQGEFQTDLAEVQTVIAKFVPDPTAQAKLQALALNAANAQARYWTIMKQLDVILLDCGMTEGARDRIQAAINKITTEDKPFNAQVKALKITIAEGAPTDLAPGQIERINAMADAAISAAIDANVTMDSLLIAIGAEAEGSGVDFDDAAKQEIRDTIAKAATLAQTDEGAAETMVDNLIVQLGGKYGWSNDAQTKLGAIITDAYKKRKIYDTKVNQLNVEAEKAGWAPGALGKMMADLNSLVNTSELDPVVLKSIWVEIANNPNITPDQITALYDSISETISAAMNKDITIDDLTAALSDPELKIPEEVQQEIREKIEGLAGKEGTEYQAEMDLIADLVFQNADGSTPEGKAIIEQFLEDLGIYNLQGTDFKTVTIESMVLAVKNVDWGEDTESRDYYIEQIRGLMHVNSSDIGSVIDQLIVTMEKNPHIPGPVLETVRQLGGQLHNTFAAAYSTDLDELLQKEEKLRKKRYIGSFVTDQESGVMIKNKSSLAKGMKTYFKDQKEVTEEALDDYATWLEEQIHSGKLSPEELAAGIDGLGISDDEFIQNLFPHGTESVIDPEYFREVFGPLAEAYITGASDEFRYRLSRNEPDQVDFSSFFIGKDFFKKDDGTGNLQSMLDYSTMLDNLVKNNQNDINSILERAEDSPVTVVDILEAMYGENADWDFRRMIESQDTEGIFADMWAKMQEDMQLAIESGEEFDPTQWIKKYLGDGELIAETVSEQLDNDFQTYLNLDPAKRAFVDKLMELMHPGEEVDPKEFYKELDDLFSKLGIHTQELMENGEWLVGMDPVTMKQLLSADDPFKFIAMYLQDSLDELDKYIPGIKQAYNEWAGKAFNPDGTFKEQTAEEVKKEVSEGVAEGAKEGVEEAAAKTEGSDLGVGDLVSNLFSGDKGLAGKAMEALQNGLQGENSEEYKSQLGEALKSALGLDEGFDASSLFGENGIDLSGLGIDADSFLGDFDSNSLIEKIIGGISTGTLDTSKLNEVGGFLTGGLGQGMLSNLLPIQAGGEGMVGTLMSTICNLLGIHSPSTVMATIGAFVGEGLAIGLITSRSKVIRQMMATVQSAIKTVKDRYENFETAGSESGSSYARGLSSASSLARIGAEMIASAAEWAIRSQLYVAEDLGEDWGKGFVKGIESQVDEARAAGRKIGNATEQGEREATSTSSPSKVAKRLGNYWGMGYVSGLNEYVKKAGRAGEDIGKATINALETPMRIIQDIIDSDVDASPVITPVLDLSNIQNGARRIDGLLPTGARSLGAISYSMANRHETTNADVVSAILGLSGSMEGSRGDTYNINGVTYDDGSNIVDAVQTLVRAARVERRR